MGLVPLFDLSSFTSSLLALQGLQIGGTGLSLPRKFCVRVEVSMNRLRSICILLVVAATSTALAQQGQQQVQPIPLTPTPLLSSQASTACLIGCDTQVMSCQNACVAVGPSTAPGGAINPSCAISCTTQQLVCKQACNQPRQ
jgi:hypothetical protein